MAKNKTYIYCNVLPFNYRTAYLYIGSDKYQPGDIVIIPLGSANNERVGLVLEVNEYEEADVPFPIERTKHILRLFGNNESEKLVKEKIKVDAEKDERFKTTEQLDKLSIKEALLINGVGRSEINAGKEQIKSILKSIPNKSQTISDVIADLFGGVVLSPDGKTVTGFKNKAKSIRNNIHIPFGVEAIEDNAFLNVRIDTLFIPKELKHLGKFTLFEPSGKIKSIESIKVENGSNHFISDEIGFYSIAEGKKALIYLFDNSITTYISPEDVSSIEKEVFKYCSNLKSIVLSEGLESFDEYSLPYGTQVGEVYLPKTMKHIHTKNIFYRHCNLNTLPFRIDEENERMFTDEDSIYEVLEDGTYRLVANLYAGKGEALLLEGTSVIGAKAFEHHTNITKIDLPKSLRKIEECAFAQTGLKSLVIPEWVERIESRAFSQCYSLESVQLHSNLKYIAEDAFESCSDLRKIKTKGAKNAFSFENGKIKRNN